MTINAVMAKLAMDGGFSFVCAHCQELWEGIAVGVRGCRVKECGGPIAKLDYPLYRGVLPPEAISMSCFACGKTATHRFFREGLQRPVGMCDEHIHLLTDYEEKKPA